MGSIMIGPPFLKIFLKIKTFVNNCLVVVTSHIYIPAIVDINNNLCTLKSNASNSFNSLTIQTE